MGWLLAEAAGEYDNEKDEEYQNHANGSPETANVSVAFAWIYIVHLYVTPLLFLEVTCTVVSAVMP